MITIEQKLLKHKHEYEEEREANQKQRKKVLFQHAQRDLDDLIHASTIIYAPECDRCSIAKHLMDVMIQYQPIFV